MPHSDFTHHKSLTPSVLPGTGRVGLVRAYFDISAVLVGVITGGILAVTLWPSLVDYTAPPSHPWLSIAAGALFTYGSVETSRLRRDRQRFGAWAAGLTFAASLVATSTHTASLATVGLGLLGLGLLASVWRYLE
jgi:hypothetical protein